MATRRHNIIVLAVSALVASGILFIHWKGHGPQHLQSRVYQAGAGWGYDILVSNKLLIHQVSIPGIAGKKSFSRKEQAEKTACLIINKMERGQSPTVTTFEINQICASTAENGEQGKH